MKRKILRIIGISFFIFLIYMINAKAINAYSFERELKDSTGWSTIDLNIKFEYNRYFTKRKGFFYIKRIRKLLAN